MELTNSGWSKTSVREAIKLHDLFKGASLKVLHSKYGYKIVKGQIQLNKKEQEVIRLILKLHDEGKSFRQITKHLNDKKIKSKKGGNWDKSVVSAIVKREQGN